MFPGGRDPGYAQDVIVTIGLWVLAAVLLVPALAMLYYLLRGHGGGKVLDHLIGVAILGTFGGICLAHAIQRTF